MAIAADFGIGDQLNTGSFKPHTQRIPFLDEQKAKRENRSLESVVAESTGSIPLGRYGNPEEYGDVVTFLASSRAGYLTGSVIRIDGGLIASI